MYLSASSNYSHIVHRFLNPIKHSRSFIKQYIKHNIYTKINVQGGILLVFFKSITFWSKGCHITLAKLTVCRLRYVVIQFYSLQ